MRYLLNEGVFIPIKNSGEDFIIREVVCDKNGAQKNSCWRNRSGTHEYRISPGDIILRISRKIGEHARVKILLVEDVQWLYFYATTIFDGTLNEIALLNESLKKIINKITEEI